MPVTEQAAALGAAARRDESDHLYGAGLGTLLSLDDLELDLRALLQHGAADVVGVNEHVLPATVRRDETKTLGRVEKLHRTFLHLRVLVSISASRKWEAGVRIRPAQEPGQANTLTPLAIGSANRVSLTVKKAKVASGTGSLKWDDPAPRHGSLVLFSGLDDH